MESNDVLHQRAKYLEKEREYRIYGIFSDLNDPSGFIGHELPPIPEQTVAEIEEYGCTQVVIHFSPDDSCILSVEGCKEYEDGVDYQTYYQTTISLLDATDVIERVSRHTPWYDDHGHYF